MFMGTQMVSLGLYTCKNCGCGGKRESPVTHCWFCGSVVPEIKPIKAKRLTRR